MIEYALDSWKSTTYGMHMVNHMSHAVFNTLVNVQIPYHLNLLVTVQTS